MSEITAQLSEKQLQFNAAMERYTTRPVYRRFGYVIAVLNVSLQAVLLVSLISLPLDAPHFLLAFIAAYLLTDFVNGLVHMYMDNNERYTSIDGPLIANFHLHHKQPMYARRPVAVVYFLESGSKVWLVPTLALVVILRFTTDLDPLLIHILVYFGILSSVAEVSHYLCHTSTARLPQLLASCGLLLSKRRHARHHLQDNCNYTFLNGWTDPLVNLIAARLCGGYKLRSDRHFAGYSGLEGDSR